MGECSVGIGSQRWRVGLGTTSVRPINTKNGEDMDYGEEVDKGVLELRKWLRERMMVNMRKVRTIEEIVGEDVVESQADSFVEKILTAVNIPKSTLLLVHKWSFSSMYSARHSRKQNSTFLIPE